MEKKCMILFLWTFSCLVLKTVNISSKSFSNRTVSGSCTNRCDHRSTEECSCDIACDLDKSCCKDFLNVCLEDNDLPAVNFIQLLDLAQECKYSLYLVISSCLYEDSMTSRSQSDKSSYDLLEMLRNITNSSDSLSQLFQQVPVTDLDSGLTFKNISIYLCNKRSVQSLLVWNVHMELFKFDNHKVLLQNLLSQVRYTFFPPRVKKADRILQCTEDMRLHYKTAPSKNYDKLLQINYLKRKGINSYCSLCLNSDDALTQNNEIDTYDRIEALYPLIASFSIKPNKLQLEITLIPTIYTDIKWNTIHCSNSNTDDKMSSLCEINMCKETFSKTEEGDCKYLHLLKLSVLEEDKLISRTFLNKLSYYVQCYLSTYAGYDVINEFNVSKIYYNQQFERLFYVTEFVVLMNKETYPERNQEDEIVHFTHFAKLIRSLASIRAQMTPQELQQPPDRNTMEILEFGGTHYKYLVPNSLIMTTINALNRSQNITPVCARLSPIHVNGKDFSRLQPLCVYVSKGDNDIGLKSTENNVCRNILTASGHGHKELSFIIFAITSVSLLISSQA